MILSAPDAFCLSISMCAPDTSLIALMWLPPRPITLLIAFEGTFTFLDLKATEKL